MAAPIIVGLVDVNILTAVAKLVGTVVSVAKPICTTSAYGHCENAKTGYLNGYRNSQTANRNTFEVHFSKQFQSMTICPKGDY